MNLFCNATGNPQPDITWTKEGESSVQSTLETLKLTNLSSKVNGQVYICKVNNSLGFDEANATVTVFCEYTENNWSSRVCSSYSFLFYFSLYHYLTTFGYSHLLRFVLCVFQLHRT